MSTVETGPTLGPCEAWVTTAEVEACCSIEGTADETALEAAAVEASMVLFELTARQFPGQCRQTTRPCADGCGCWDWLFFPANPPGVQVGTVAWGWGDWGGAGWGWGWSGCTETCGCGTLSRALLPGYPVNEIIEVQIDGEIIDPDTYRLDSYTYLTRLASDDGSPRFWPACQDLARQPGEPGTFTVEYLFGQAPPLLGVKAAAQLACELYRLCTDAGFGTCALPSGVTKITRQGVTIERSPFVSWAFKKGSWGTGLAAVDMFLQTYNPGGLRRRTAVWSPDLPGYGLRVQAET